jgi:multimeric flavodoxin WrbA
MKAIAIVGSPRVDGNTEALVRHALKALEEQGLSTELIPLANLRIEPCTACGACRSKEICSIDDDLWPIYEKMKAAQAIILASPVYFGSATSNLKALMDRSGYIAIWNHRPFDGKIGGPIVVGEREGHNFTIAQIAYWFYYMGCTIPGSTGWNVAFGLDRGEVQQDKQGLQTVYGFGKRVARLVKILNELPIE